MRILFIILGVIAGAFIALILNKLLADKIENKNHKLALKISAHFVFCLLGLLYVSVGSLKPALNKFIDGRISAIELTLNKNFPNTKIMEININTNEFVEVSRQLQQSLKDIDKSGDGFFERLVFDAFIAKLTPYITAVDGGINAVAMMSNEQGNVTIKSVLLNLKGMALDAISPYFIIFNILIIIILFIFIGVYLGIAIHLKKGGAMYNKSIVFGDN